MSSSLAFPDELNYDMLKSMYPGQKTELRKMPINGTSFTSGDIVFVLPKQEASFYDPNTLAISFSAKYAMAAGTAGTDRSYVLGSGYSHFRRQTVRALANGAVLESIDNCNLLVHKIFEQTLSLQDKKSLSCSIGFEGSDDTTNTNLGPALDAAAAAGNVTISYSIPLLGILNAAKLIPSFVSDFEITLTLADLTTYITNLTANGNCTGVTLENLEISCETLTLESESMRALMSQFGQTLRIKSDSYLYGGSSLASATGAGTVDIVYPHSCNSLKRFCWWASPANVGELNFGGVNPNLQNWNLLIGSKSYPQQPVAANRVASSFIQNQKSWASMYSPLLCGNVSRASFAVASTAYAGSEFAAYRTKQSLANTKLRSLSNQWSQWLDLETINLSKSSLFTGISTKGSTNTMRLSIGTQLAAVAHALHFFSNYDVILEFDTQNQAVNVIQ
jgi:hypothetical protein